MAKRQKFHVGDQVRVKQYGGRVGDTLYEVTKVYANGLDCLIREVELFHGKPDREQRFDTSLLVLAGVKRNGCVYTTRRSHRTGLWEVIETRDSGNRPWAVLKTALRTEAAADKIIARIAAGEDFKVILAI